ncbi:MAG: uracil-DNA glycosylase [Alphaproteobacteria bacterium]
MDRALESILSWWDAAGVDVPEISAVKPKLRRSAPPQSSAAPNHASRNVAQTPRESQPSAKLAPAAPSPESTEVARTAKTLEGLKNILADFNAGDMSDHARQAVFSRGNPEADIMVIGEVPSQDDDITGKSFAGPPGRLLDKIFASIGLGENELYLTQVVNWCPPGGRNPTKEEIALCLPFITRHIELIDPKIIVLVGGLSLSAMTGQTSIMKNRGQWTDLKIGGKTIPALPLYHPDFLLRQPTMKKDCWRDILSLRESLAELG